jgi:hypothetical protein
VPGALAIASALAANPLIRYFDGIAGRGGAAPFQRDFHEAQENERCLLAATKLGKSYCGAAEMWCHMLGWHPHRPVPAPGSFGLILVQDLSSGWPELSRVIRKLEPPGVLADNCRYVKERGYLGPEGRSMIIINNGSSLRAFGCKQDAQALEGWDAQYAWVNEVPKKVHYDSLTARLSLSAGPLWITTTPIGKPTDWLREKVEGMPDEGSEPKEPGWWFIHAALTIENAPHRTPEDIAKAIARCDEWERRQRIEAQWDGITPGRKLAAFGEGQVMSVDDMPTDLDEVRLHIDHGEGEGKELAYISGRVGRTFYLFDEYVSNAEHGFDPRDHARGILQLLSNWGLTVHHLDRCIGDTNMVGMLQAGVKYNDLLSRAIDEELRAKGLPPAYLSIEPARKGPGSVKAGESAMNAAIREGRWFVSERCRKFIHMARHYTGKEKDLKDAADAARYGWSDWLLQPWQQDEPVTVVL